MIGDRDHLELLELRWPQIKVPCTIPSELAIVLIGEELQSNQVLALLA
jgi:hypothetical protein